MTSASPFSNAGQETAVPPDDSDVTLAAMSAGYEALPEHPSPAQAEESQWHGERAPADPVIVIVSQVAMGQIEAHSHSDLVVELGGALLGHAYQNEGQTYVEILAALPAANLDHGPVHFTFTADAWSELHQAWESHYPELSIVGWFHTHPDLGVFFSADDVIVHSAAFTLPWHVGFVLDPIRAEGCFFGWADPENGREIIPLAGFYERLDEQAGSSINWQYVRRVNWAPPANVFSQASQAGKVLLAETEWPALPPISPWWGVFLGGLSLLISLFLLFERLLAR